MTPRALTDSSPERDARLRFMGIDADTGARLRDFWTVVEPELPAILEGFYRHVTSEPRLARLLGDDVPRLKGAQGAHWAQLFGGRFDGTYMRGVRAIGLIHNKIGLEPRWYIGGYNYVLGRLVALAVRHMKWRPHRLTATLAAINAAVMLDMDLAISAYQEAMLAEREARQVVMADAIHRFDQQITTALGTVDGAAGRMRDTADRLSSNADAASRQSTTVAAASRQASANVQTVATAASQLSATVEEISRQVTLSTHIAAQAVGQANHTDAMVRGLTDRARQIGDVVDLIGAVAAQTNLLALNATIEAARAGDSGKGFAVVATEVKALAGQTAQATEEISHHVGAIQAATRESATAIQAIATTIGEISRITATIAAAVEQQGAATREITRNADEAARGTREMDGTIHDLSVAAGEDRVMAGSVQSAVHDLSRQSAALRGQIEGFFATIRNA
ncbi:globin-coupled sensor protein [Azospirillum sp. B4]|uniref:globin-coupled sensor protein n=1 Tax=Azospirillum sp. B4 TaxID=95605 RepID=UPI00034C0D11|nr:globin-coupled sensor protein [Azospirillum sp. B4]